MKKKLVIGTITIIIATLVSCIFIKSKELKVKIKDKERLSSAEGKGPVDAIDTALRKAIGKVYKSMINIKLIDYKVRALDSSKGCEARVLVNIQTSNGKKQWNTIGVSTDIVSATTEALIDSIEYAKLCDYI